MEEVCYWGGLCFTLPNLCSFVYYSSGGVLTQGLALGQYPTAAPNPSPTVSEGLGRLVGGCHCFQMLLSAVTGSSTRSLCLQHTSGPRLLLKIWYFARECGGLSQPLRSQVSWDVTVTSQVSWDVTVTEEVFLLGGVLRHTALYCSSSPFLLGSGYQAFDFLSQML